MCMIIIREREKSIAYLSGGRFWHLLLVCFLSVDELVIVFLVGSRITMLFGSCSWLHLFTLKKVYFFMQVSLLLSANMSNQVTLIYLSSRCVHCLVHEFYRLEHNFLFLHLAHAQPLLSISIHFPSQTNVP